MTHYLRTISTRCTGHPWNTYCGCHYDKSLCYGKKIARQTKTPHQYFPNNVVPSAKHQTYSRHTHIPPQNPQTFPASRIRCISALLPIHRPVPLESSFRCSRFGDKLKKSRRGGESTHTDVMRWDIRKAPLATIHSVRRVSTNLVSARSKRAELNISLIMDAAISECRRNGRTRMEGVLISVWSHLDAKLSTRPANRKLKSLAHHKSTIHRRGHLETWKQDSSPASKHICMWKHLSTYFAPIPTQCWFLGTGSKPWTVLI